MDRDKFREMLDRVIQQAEARLAEPDSFDTVQEALARLERLIIQNGRDLTAMSEELKRLKGATAMSVMLSELYKALLEAPPSEDQARRAAEEVAAYENRFAKVEADLLVLKWMVGVLITLSLVNLGLVFQILGRLPR